MNPLLSFSEYPEHFNGVFKKALSQALEALPHAYSKTAFAPAVDIALAKGKRVRPYLFSLAANDTDVVSNMAIALELLHSFALVHDDIIDASDSRRGTPTAHMVVGTDKALLAGDWLLMLSHLFFYKGNPTPQQSECWYQLQEEVLTGQVLDIDTSVHEANIDLVFEKTYLKTATYTITRPLLLGALMGNFSQMSHKWIDSFGRHLGMAFQLQDDLLDLLGDPEKTGKPLLHDIEQDTATYFTSYAVNQGATFMEYIGQPITHEQAIIIRNQLQATGAIEHGKQRIKDHFLAVEKLLKTSPFTNHQTLALGALVEQLQQRNS